MTDDRAAKDGCTAAAVLLAAAVGWCDDESVVAVVVDRNTAAGAEHEHVAGGDDCALPWFHTRNEIFVRLDQAMVDKSPSGPVVPVVRPWGGDEGTGERSGVLVRQRVADDDRWIVPYSR